jgi:hypothetical protein
MHPSHHGGKPKQEGPRHNMLVVGQTQIFLSHLPMFMVPHNLQLILEATFRSGDRDAGDIYFQDRKTHPKTKVYTLEPEVFEVETLFAPPSGQAARRDFEGTVFQGHLERGGHPIDALAGIQVNITNVVYSQVFGPGLDKSAHLEYILFGKGPEFFLAHVIAAPPDFDQVLSVTIENPPTPDELARGVRVSLPDRSNTAAQRIREGEKFQAQGHAAGAHQFLSLDIQAGLEYYLEEGELASQM